MKCYALTLDPIGKWSWDMWLEYTSTVMDCPSVASWRRAYLKCKIKDEIVEIDWQTMKWRREWVMGRRRFEIMPNLTLYTNTHLRVWRNHCPSCPSSFPSFWSFVFGFRLLRMWKSLNFDCFSNTISPVSQKFTEHITRREWCASNFIKTFQFARNSHHNILWVKHSHTHSRKHTRTQNGLSIRIATIKIASWPPNTKLSRRLNSNWHPIHGNSII